MLGYGINVGAAAYPPELRDRATSLESELGRPVDRATLLAETLAALARRYDDLLAGRFDAILDAWRARAPAARGARVDVDDRVGRAVGHHRRHRRPRRAAGARRRSDRAHRRGRSDMVVTIALPRRTREDTERTERRLTSVSSVSVRGSVSVCC